MTTEVYFMVAIDMDFKLTWRKPIPLRESGPETNLIYELDLDQIPPTPGVYVFMRSFGKKLTPLYVGKAGNLNGRIKQQLNALKLMKGIHNADIGARVIVIG